MNIEIESALYDWINVHKFPQSYTIEYVCHLYNEYLKGYVHFDFVVVKCISPVKQFKKVNDTVYCLGGVFEVKDYNSGHEYVLDMDDGLLINGDFKSKIEKYHVVSNNFICDYTDFRHVLIADKELYDDY